MEIITAPEPTPDAGDLFLAGGISNCPLWQNDVLEMIKDIDAVTFNPRRENYTSDDVAREQIRWEHKALRKVKIISFWFPAETLCPITLYELGVFSQLKDIHVLVGTHPEYARRLDVVEQLSLERPEIVVGDSIEQLVADVRVALLNR